MADPLRMGFWAELFKTKRQRLNENKALLLSCKNSLRFENEAKLLEIENSIPLVSAKNRLVNTLKTFENQRNTLDLQWKQAYAKFSWWNKMSYSEGIDLTELDKQIKSLKIAKENFDQKYGRDINKIKTHFYNLESLSRSRLEIAHQNAVNELEKYSVKKVDKNLLVAGWLATLSVPISIWDDLAASEKVYDALRSVNGNFAESSNLDIWWETLWLSPQSYTGLVSLTKGAYFESLVAHDTGGQLHDHFNHPGTDIVIDGVEVQLKATDSIAYINTVADDIPVIATTEVALNTDAADSGYSNNELTNSVEHALGGSVIDAKDTAVDAILTGVGSLGVFATIRGINHASARYHKGVKGVEAIFEGAGIAIEGTAKGLVDASEMVYNVAMSRPSRFVGRTIAKAFIKLDEKLMSTDETSKDRK